MKVSCNALEMEVMIAVTSTITPRMWKAVPALFWPTLTLNVCVQLDKLEAIVKMVS